MTSKISDITPTLIHSQKEINDELAEYKYTVCISGLQVGDFDLYVMHYWNRSRTEPEFKSMFEDPKFGLTQFTFCHTKLLGTHEPYFVKFQKNEGFVIGLDKNAFFSMTIPDASLDATLDAGQGCKIYICKYVTKTKIVSQNAKIYAKTMEHLKMFMTHYAEYCEHNIYKLSQNKKIYMYTVVDSRWRIAKSDNNNSWKNVFISENHKTTLNERIKTFLLESERKRCVDLGHPYKLNILLYGVPGAGKTTIIKTLSNVFKRKLYLFNFSPEITDSAFSKLWSDIPENSIVAFEDIDAYFNRRVKTSDNRNVNFSSLLNQLDGIQNSDRGLITVLTANHINNLDPALVRPGRIDLIIHFDYPEESVIRQAFEYFTMRDQSEPEKEFQKFYKNIKNLKVPMSGITDYLFRHQKDYLENVQELIESYKQVQEITTDKTNGGMYM